MQQIYRRKVMPKSDLLHIFRTPFSRNATGYLLLKNFRAISNDLFQASSDIFR